MVLFVLIGNAYQLRGFVRISKSAKTKATGSVDYAWPVAVFMRLAG